MIGADLETWSGRAFLDACLAELRAPKPGNVHDFAAGHRMSVADFETSARVAAPHLARAAVPVGQRVRAAVRATAEAVGCNTNLGILLLAAPLAATADRLGGPAPEATFRSTLGNVLEDLTVDDAAAVFDAIVTANPGGLGEAPEHDVSGPAKVTLRQAMAAAADRDSIARQYVTTCRDLFEIGLQTLRAMPLDELPTPRATLQVYYAFAQELPDSHIGRKHGPAVAEEVRQEFRKSAAAAARYDLPQILLFDQELKARGLNPGTTADLTVATLYLARLTGMEKIT